MELCQQKRLRPNLYCQIGLPLCFVEWSFSLHFMLHPVYLLEYIQASPQGQAVPSAGKWYKTKVQPLQGLHLLYINDVNQNLLSSPLVFQRYPHRPPALFKESQISQDCQQSWTAWTWAKLNYVGLELWPSLFYLPGRYLSLNSTFAQQILLLSTCCSHRFLQFWFIGFPCETQACPFPYGELRPFSWCW